MQPCWVPHHGQIGLCCFCINSWHNSSVKTRCLFELLVSSVPHCCLFVASLLPPWLPPGCLPCCWPLLMSTSSFFLFSQFCYSQCESTHGRRPLSWLDIHSHSLSRKNVSGNQRPMDIQNRVFNIIPSSTFFLSDESNGLSAASRSFAFLWDILWNTNFIQKMNGAKSTFCRVANTQQK